MLKLQTPWYLTLLTELQKRNNAHGIYSKGITLLDSVLFLMYIHRAFAINHILLLR